MPSRVRRLVKDALRRSGLEVKRARAGFHYAPDYYGQSFARRTDIRGLPGFGELARATIAEGRSCLYYDRLYVLYQVLESLKRHAVRPLRIVEVGVYKGGTTAYLARAAAALELAVDIHACDTFEGHAAVDIDASFDTIHRAGDFDDTSFDGVARYLTPFRNVALHKGRFADTCSQLPPGPIALMHLDVDLYAPTVHALEFADARMVAGGVVVVDDYEVKNTPGVKSAIEHFLASHSHYVTLHPLTEQCVLVKVGS
jgi:hypothetical protein